MTSKAMISPKISPQKVPGIFVHILNRKISVLVSTSFPTCLTNWATLTSDYNNFNEPNKKLPRVQLMGQVQIGRPLVKVNGHFRAIVQFELDSPNIMFLFVYLLVIAFLIWSRTETSRSVEVSPRSSSPVANFRSNRLITFPDRVFGRFSTQ